MSKLNIQELFLSGPKCIYNSIIIQKILIMEKCPKKTTCLKKLNIKYYKIYICFSR